MQRKTKQIIVISVFALIAAALLGLLLVLLFNPSCDDGKKNGDEEGVDCGGSCPKKCVVIPELGELQIEGETMLKDSGRYDIAAEVVNPNSGFGFYPVVYRMVLYRSSSEVCRRTGETYIMPKERFYLIETGIECESTPDSIEIVIESAEPQELRGEEVPKLDILSQNFRYTRIAGSFFEANFQIANRSNFDFLVMDLGTVVKDASGQIIAVNRANLNSVRAGEVRDFRFFWPREFSGAVKRVETEARANIFDPDNL